jgi:hypothetical protein
MESNLMASEPSALVLRERERGGEQEKPEGQAHDDAGKGPSVERSPLSWFPERLASMTLVAFVVVVQLLWAALLAYAALSAVRWLPL